MYHIGDGEDAASRIVPLALLGFLFFKSDRKMLIPASLKNTFCNYIEQTDS